MVPGSVSMKNQIVQALRDLVSEIYSDCYGCNGAAYSGECEDEIQKLVTVFLNANTKESINSK